MAEEHRYCVICGRTYGPGFISCCTPNSLVRLVRSGWLRKREVFYDAEGKELDDAALAEWRRRQVDAAAAEESRLRRLAEGRRQWILGFIRFYRSLGFFVEELASDGEDEDERPEPPDGPHPVGLRRFSDEELADLLISHCEREQGPGVKHGYQVSDSDLLGYDTARVWTLNLSYNGVSEGLRVYEWALMEWARISRGVFEPDQVDETWATQYGPITVEVLLDGSRHALHPALDWGDFDTGIVNGVNALIKHTGHRFVCLAHGEQEILVFLLSDEEHERAARERGIP